MRPNPESRYIAFQGTQKLAVGDLFEVAKKTKSTMNPRAEEPLVFDVETSEQIEIDWRGNAETVVTRLRESIPEPNLKSPGPGRPRLGVISREISLLPRHWDWLALQPGGASATLRQLIEEAKKRNQGQDGVRIAQESTYKFMSILGGNLPHYEEALRALYAKKRSLFETLVAAWPKDVRDHTKKLALPVWGEDAS